MSRGGHAAAPALYSDRLGSTLASVIDALALAGIVGSLAVAVWAFLLCARNELPSRSLYVGMVVVAALVAAQVGIATVRLIGGAGPSGSSRIVTFVGYMLTALLLPPAGAVLARLEPTRWGSALIGAAMVIVPVLILRMQQVWGG
jgi:hypothetical protein